MKKYSVTVAMSAVIFCMVLGVTIGFFAPGMVRWFCEYRNLYEGVGTAILITYYVCLPVALAALWCLLKLLKNIRNGEMFKRKNPGYMSAISYCCLIIAAACIGCGLRYIPMLFIGYAMLFLFLIVRVVRLCFIAATEMKEENDLTI